jgi:MYXO-CTERM domain-containing protein
VDVLGGSLSLSGDVAAVVEPGAMYAYIFARSGYSWAQQAKINIAPVQSYAIAASGDTVAIGKPNEWTGTAYQGGVHVYRRSGTTWSEEQNLQPSDSAADNFGQALALDGDTLLVGAQAGGAVPGMAFVYSRTGTTWSEQGKLQPNPTELGLFGAAVALDGDTAAIGEPLNTPNGKVFVFTRQSTAWSLQQTLVNPGGSNAYFGYAVDVDGDRLVVGAKNASTGAGAAYAYERSGSTWSAAVPIPAVAQGPSDTFGSAVAVQGTTAAVGSPLYGWGGATASTGAVELYDLAMGAAGAGGQAGSGGAAGAAGAAGSAGAGGQAGGGGSGASGGSSGGSAGGGGTVASGGAAGSSGGSSGAGATGGASAGTGGEAPSGAASGDDGGCGCRTQPSPRVPVGGWLFGVALALAFRRARRRRGA